MQKIEGKRFTLVLPLDLVDRMEKQMEKEGRGQAEFIRRVLDRYLLEQEFRGDIPPDVAASIAKNKELLRLLKDG
jgi:metal-responsive CopG/Arc/MetJ family transcriptional regulator